MADSWEVVICPEQDGSPGFTLRERESGQLMHSRIGPWTEANTVYVAQSEALFRPAAESIRRDSPGSPDGVVLYDVGMGIAANALAAIAAAKRRSPAAKLKIFSFERYPEALVSALEHRETFPLHEPYREILHALVKNGEWRSPSGEHPVEWRLIPGDFREAPLGALPQADLVYFDFYAPSVCPELWGVDVFLKLRARVASSGLLITYSTTKAVRAALLLAGFYVGEGAATPMKSATTLAAPELGQLRAPLDKAWLAGLARAVKPLPDGWRKLDAHLQFGAHP